MATNAGSPAAALRVHHSLLGGREVEGRAGLRDVVSPATGVPFARVSLLDAAQSGEALEAARRAFPAWAALSFRERGRFLLRIREKIAAEADSLAGLIAREQGKPVAEARLHDVLLSLETLKHLAYHAEDVLREDPVEAQVLLFVHKDCRVAYAPYGVVLDITPWNYPMGIAVTSAAAALAAGNAVVLKPAPATTLVGLKLGELIREAGLPDGVVSVLAVDDAVAAGLVEDPRVGKVVFTGSVATGRKVMAAAAKNLTPVVLELGGKDPAVVCRNADLERAARGIVWGAFANAGQTCASVERVYVEQPAAEALVARVVAETGKLRMGDPFSPDVEIGPMTMERQRKIVEDHVADAVARGAKVLTGGRRPEGPGFFYPPTVLTGVDHTMRVMREETFGPVLPIMAVASLDDAIRLANDSDYGLTASGWTRSAETAARLRRELHAGVVTINDCVASYGEPTAPWGGVKRSGIGRTHGLAGLREMVQVKYVSTDMARAPALWWYPYGSEFARLNEVILDALHGGSVVRRIVGLARILAFPRFWRRLGLLRVLKHADRLF